MIPTRAGTPLPLKHSLLCFVLFLLSACGMLIPAKRVMPPEQGLIFYTVENTPAPTVVLLSGCGGMQAATAPPIVKTLNENGFNAVTLDYVKVMGLEQACLGQIKPDRFLALLSEAMAYLVTRPEVDKNHIALLGWSLGASAALTYAGTLTPGEQPAISAVVAYYPGCYDGLQLSLHPTLMLLGMADNVVDANACIELAQRSPSTPIVVKSYPGTQHNFDNPKFKQPQSMYFFWKKLSSAYDPKATADAEKATIEFLKKHSR